MTADLPRLSFHHGAASVPSLDAEISWYREVLGFQLESRFPIPKANAEAAMLVNGPLRIELFEVAGAAPLPPGRDEPNLDVRTHGNKHIAFGIDDLDDFLGLMSRKDADVAFVVRESFGKACILRDCAGNLLEFVEVAAREGDLP